MRDVLIESLTTASISGQSVRCAASANLQQIKTAEVKNAPAGILSQNFPSCLLEQDGE